MTETANKLTTLPDNALDYLLSAIEQLEQRTERSLKYSILHLFAGIELLLKERLAREHWSLIFQEIGHASKTRLHSGDFKSVDFNTSTARLTDIAGVNLSKSQLKHADSLRQLRNRIQHFHTPIGHIDATSRLAQGMNFAIHFITHEMPDLNASHKTDLTRIHGALATFNEYVSCRSNEIANDLSRFVCTVLCPRCDQNTLGLGNGNPLCPFCGFTDSPFEAMAAAAGDAVIGHCPDCRGPMGEYCYPEGDEVFEMFICFCCGKSGS